jgi:type II secretory pathway predicted ATPase ExeA
VSKGQCCRPNNFPLFEPFKTQAGSKRNGDWRPSPVFSDNAKAEIHKRSLGIPRQINWRCLLTLFEGAAQQHSIIDGSDVVSDEV